ncbi:MAG: glycosyltransferase family 4 protein [Rhodocyclaceae bacterium]|nr:MAG: glycosyltransferase family 4 protein [Rhodocyclaceae bacterium]
MTGIWIPLVAGLLSWAVVWAMLRFRVSGPLDHPNERSLHQAPIPRSGGIGILVGLVTALVLGGAAWTTCLAVLLLAAVSFADDWLSLPVVLRMLCHVGAALLALYPHYGGWALALLTVVVVWSVNLYNFMDGANGLAGGMALFGFASYGVGAALAGDAGLAVAAGGVAAAALGFLIFNFDPARIFMGDVGSTVLGLLAAVFGIMGWHRDLWPFWFPVLVFSPFAVDATVTLMRRLLKGDKVWQAHREHYYQRLVRMGWSHRRLALAEYALMGAAALAALGLARSAPIVQVAGLMAWVAAYVLLMGDIDRRWLRFLASTHADTP